MDNNMNALHKIREEWCSLEGAPEAFQIMYITEVNGTIKIVSTATQAGFAGESEVAESPQMMSILMWYREVVFRSKRVDNIDGQLDEKRLEWHWEEGIWRLTEAVEPDRCPVC